MSQDVDSFVKKSKQWQDEIKSLRAIILSAKMDEELKWGKPCYSHEGSNIAIIQPFKGCLALMSFKGALLKDAKGMLIDNGPNSQSAKRLEFRSAQEISKATATIKAYIKEAIAIEMSGAQVKKKTVAQFEVPEEFQKRMDDDPKLAEAFHALTPGRQKGYLLYFAAAKQSATRAARVEKHTPRILQGLGRDD